MKNLDLLPGETVIRQCGIHPLLYTLPVGVLAIGAGFLAVRLHFFGVPLALNWSLYLGPLADDRTVSLLEAAVCTAMMLLAAKTMVDLYCMRYTVTTQRIVARRGWLSTTTSEMRITRQETVTITQDLAGQLFNFGNITVISAGATIFLANVPSPKKFRAAIYEAERR